MKSKSEKSSKSSAPEAASPKKVRVKVQAPTAFQDSLRNRLIANRPQNKKDGTRPNATYDVAEVGEILSEIKYVVRTGIRVFDDIAGGFPFGRICELYGLESSGKTAMVIRTAAMASFKEIYKVHRTPAGISYEKLDPDKCEVAVLYVDNEQSLDDDEKLKVDGVKADFITMRVDTVDLLFKAVDDVIKDTEARELELEEQGQQKHVFVVIVVDTIASTSCRQELDAEWGAEDYPRHPAQISAGFRQIVRDVNRFNICMICTNQVRDNIKEAGQNARRPRTPNPQDVEYTTFGGKALRFYASHRIFIWRKPWRYKLDPTADYQAGFILQFTTTKNRLRAPMREACMVLLFDPVQGGLNDLYSMLETMLHVGTAEAKNMAKQTDIVFKFQSNGLVPTTFGSTGLPSTTLAEDDEEVVQVKRATRRKDPSIDIKAEWPLFYAEHKADMDRLWELTLEHVFSTKGIGEEESETEALEPQS